ncbi:MAG: hypothetical protein V4538_07610 [Bacteroidota bacterium]
MKKIAVLIFTIMLVLASTAQNRVTLTQNGKTLKFAAKPNAQFENLNGMINLSIIGNNTSVIELNNIEESQFACGKRLKEETIKITYIDSKNNRTYTSVGNVQVSISCTGIARQYIVIFLGKIKNGRSTINISASLTVKSKPKEYVKTF